MKKRLSRYALFGVLCLMLAAAAYAQKASSAAPATAHPTVPAVAATPASTPPAPAQVAQAQPPSQDALKVPDAAQFSMHKQKLLENIGEHIAKMQKKQSCISSAADEKALNACFAAVNEGSPASAAVKP